MPSDDLIRHYARIFAAEMWRVMAENGRHIHAFIEPGTGAEHHTSYELTDDDK
ncbi:MAG: hypothetical protein JWM85_3610 [Acidimicrobiaceae bacterium]|nr:hypothetical protein [Acidimicrobiaceae bacterium]